MNEAGEYAWRPGFWSKTYENWVWVPDHHLWNPTGCTFVDQVAQNPRGERVLIAVVRRIACRVQHGFDAFEQRGVSRNRAVHGVA